MEDADPQQAADWVMDVIGSCPSKATSWPRRFIATYQ
jgi:hypothetical protein